MLVPSHAALINGGFESGDFTGWTPHSTMSANPPDSSIPVPQVFDANDNPPSPAPPGFGGISGDPAQTPIEGMYHAVITNGSGTAGLSGVQTFFNLAADSILNGLTWDNSSPTYGGGSGIKQTVMLNAGERIQFQYALAYEDLMYGPILGYAGAESEYSEEFAFFTLTPDGVTGDETNIHQLGFVTFTESVIYGGGPLPTPKSGTPDTIGYMTFTSAPVASTGNYQIGFGTYVYENGNTPNALNHLILLVDNVSVTTVPEPSAFLVFGAFIGIFFQRRRI